MQKKKKKRKIDKKFFLCEQTVFELVVFNCLYLTKEYLQSTVNVLKTVLRFCISLKETFSNSVTLTVINKNGEGATVHIPTVLRPVYHVALQRILSSGTF